MENHAEVLNKVTNLIVFKMFLILPVWLYVIQHFFLILLKVFLKFLLLCEIIVWNKSCNLTLFP